MEKPPNRKKPPQKKKPPQNRKQLKNKVEAKNNVKKKIKKAPSKEAILREKKRIRKLRSQRIISITAIFLIFILVSVMMVYIGRGALFAVKKKDVPTIAVEYGKMELPTILDAIIVRAEKVYKSPKDGDVFYNFNNLERVKKEALIGSVQDAQTAYVTEDIKNVSNEIFDIQKLRKDLQGFGQDVTRTEKQIVDDIDNSRYFFLTNNTENLYSLKENLERNIDVRNNILLSENRGSVKTLVNNKNVYNKKLREGSENIFTNESGILSFNVDGYEKLFNIDALNNLTKEQIGMTTQQIFLDRKEVVKKDEEIFKIINSNEWYIALFAPKSLVYDYKIDQNKTVYIEKDGAFEPYDVKIKNIIEGEKENYLVFSLNTALEEFIYTRKIKIKFSNGASEGFKVPSTAILDKTYLKIPKNLVNDDSFDYVLRKSTVDGKAKYLQVKIKAKEQDDNFVYVYQDLDDGIKVDDVLVLESDKTKETKITEIVNVKGIFILNNGYADFVKISLSYKNVEKDGYVILELENNPNIKLNDKIIYENKNLRDGQKVVE